MVTSQIEVEPHIIELSGKSFKTFCDDISGMFGMDMAVKQQGVVTETAKGLKKHFTGLVAIHSIKAEGLLNTTFQFVFDKEGLFILSGIISMQPEQMILENIKLGSLEKTTDISNIFSEVGIALVGAWDRVFCKGLPGHCSFLQTSIFIGDPWDNPQEKINLTSDEEIVFVPYEVAIGPYPAFKCGVVFPKTIFTDTSAFMPEQTISAEKKTQEKIAEEAVEQIVKTDRVADELKPAEEKITSATASDSEKRPISETIQEMAQSAAVLPGESTVPTAAEKIALDSSTSPLTICAKDIMQKDILWCSPDDNVQHALTKIQQYNAGYVMIGQDGSLEGIVSRSDLTAATSPYLRPAFAKWRRPLDDATLQIRLKCIMSSPVDTIELHTPLMEIMGKMCQFGRRALAVVDQQGKVRGLITVFDIFKTLLLCLPHSLDAKK